MLTYEICCDGCAADLALKVAECRLVLASQTLFSSGREPLIARPHHFCGLRCLGQWMADKHPIDVVEGERMQG